MAIKIFFGHFCQKADGTSGQTGPNPENRLQKSFFLLELQELEVRAKFAQTAGFGQILNSCSSERQKDFCYLCLGSD